MEFSDVQTCAEVPYRKGRTVVVRVVCASDAEDHYAVDVRERIDRSSAELRGVVAGKGRTRSTYTGYTRSGLYLSPLEAMDIADALARAAVIAGSREEEVA